MRDTDGSEWDGCDPRYNDMWQREMSKPSRSFDRKDAQTEISRMNTRSRHQPARVVLSDSEEFAVKIQRRF